MLKRGSLLISDGNVDWSYYFQIVKKYGVGGLCNVVNRMNGILADAGVLCDLHAGVFTVMISGKAPMSYYPLLSKRYYFVRQDFAEVFLQAAVCHGFASAEWDYVAQIGADGSFIKMEPHEQGKKGEGI